VNAAVPPSGPSPSIAGKRRAGLRERLSARSLDALLLTSLPNIRYMTGFTGSNALAVITRRGGLFVSDSRYRLQSAAEVKGLKRVIGSAGLLEDAAAARALARCRNAGFEADSLTYAQYRSLKKLFPRVAFRPVTGLVEEMALVKDRDEIAAIAGAARVADSVFRDVLKAIRAGATELDIAAEITWLTRRRGGDADAFDVIVASGPNGALPHARPGARKIRTGDFVIMDFGAVVQGYCSDLTRTVCVGAAPRAMRKAYDAVLEAHAAALRAAHGDMPARALDAAARGVLRRRGFGRYFTHSLGHGLGLRVHERPRVSPASGETLRTGSVITIEPGVYIPGKGGVRIEDDVLLEGGGCRLLTASPRQLILL